MADWVIVVDDDETNLKVAGHILSRAHMRVTAMKSGEALINYIREKEVPDLILLDVKMPGMSGFETLEALREVPKGKLNGDRHQCGANRSQIQPGRKSPRNKRAHASERKHFNNRKQAI